MPLHPLALANRPVSTVTELAIADQQGPSPLVQAKLFNFDYAFKTLYVLTLYIKLNRESSFNFIHFISNKEEPQFSSM